MALGFLSGAAHAETTKFCFTILTAFSDSGGQLSDTTKEDYWTTNTYQPARGVWAVVKRGTTTYFSDYLDDGVTSTNDGCTPSINVPNLAGSTFTATLSLNASVQGNTVRVRQADVPSVVYAQAVTWTQTLVASSITRQMAPSDGIVFGQTTMKGMFNVLMAMAFAQYRHAGGMTGKTYTARVGGYSTTRANISAGYLEIQDSRALVKFVVVHEVGHLLYEFASARAPWIGGYDVDELPCVATDNPKTHSLRSKEHDEVGFDEGSAHFYAADVWNSHADQDCVYNYYKFDVPVWLSTGGGAFGIEMQEPVFDCEAATSDLSLPLRATTPAPNSTAPYPLRTMETFCGGSFADRSVEADWLRTLWDLHTSGTTPPTFTEIVGLLNGAFAIALPGYSVYQEVSDEAAVRGGSVAGFDLHAIVNGVDH